MFSVILLNLMIGAIEVPEDYVNIVVVNDPFDERAKCSDHPLGTLPYLGDALGRDCSFGDIKNEGRSNEDYEIYGAPVYAPIGGTVVDVHVNPVENTPGTIGSGRATGIIISRDDGMFLLIGHLLDMQVEVGDVITARQLIGYVGNNGYSTGPHIHMGAWKDGEAYQIIFDIRTSQ